MNNKVITELLILFNEYCSLHYCNYNTLPITDFDNPLCRDCINKFLAQQQTLSLLYKNIKKKDR